MTVGPALRLLDLFAGAGGMSLGWMLASGGKADLVAAVDSDASLRELYSLNFPKARFIQHTFDATDARASLGVLAENGLRRGDIDVLLAGPPCQSLSPAGKRVDHLDNRLALRVVDVAEALRPRVLMLENVPELARIHDGRLLGRVRVGLRDLGYSTTAVTLNATAFGVPQARVRLFLVAIVSDESVSLRPEPTHTGISAVRDGGVSTRRHSVALPPALSVRDAIGDLPSLAAGEDCNEYVVEPATAFQRWARGSVSLLTNHSAVSHSSSILAMMRGLAPGGSPRDDPANPRGKPSYFRAAYARLDPDQPASTITTQTHNPGSGRFTHYRDDRVLTVREVARLQTFPDSFTFVGHGAQQRRHVGNAVPPLLASAIARSLLELMDDQRYTGRDATDSQPKHRAGTSAA